MPKEMKFDVWRPCRTCPRNFQPVDAECLYCSERNLARSISMAQALSDAARDILDLSRVMNGQKVEREIPLPEDATEIMARLENAIISYERNIALKVGRRVPAE